MESRTLKEGSEGRFLFSSVSKRRRWIVELDSISRDQVDIRPIAPYIWSSWRSFVLHEGDAILQAEKEQQYVHTSGRGLRERYRLLPTGPLPLHLPSPSTTSSSTQASTQATLSLDSSSRTQDRKAILSQAPAVAFASPSKSTTPRHPPTSQSPPTRPPLHSTPIPQHALLRSNNQP